MRLGLHLSLGPNMVGGVRRAVEIGAQALQLFCGSPRSWSKTPFDPAVLEGFVRERRAADLHPLAIHATYLLNPAAPDEAIWQHTAEALAVELARARDMQADFYVIHPGSHRGEGLPAAYSRIARCLEAAWKVTPDAPPVLFENTAGAGATVGRSFTELGDLLRIVAAPTRTGVCLDTCHAYAAGYDITTPTGCAAMREEMERALGGLAPIRMLHINDSKFACGENKDRHEHIGLGHIGEAGFRTFFRTFPFDDRGGILETPQDEEDDDRTDLRKIERLTSGGGRPGLDRKVADAGLGAKKASGKVQSNSKGKAAATKPRRKSAARRKIGPGQ
ncbi:MAG: deoxyribonuclease IV [Planctomycetota bacterium]